MLKFKIEVVLTTVCGGQMGLMHALTIWQRLCSWAPGCRAPASVQRQQQLCVCWQTLRREHEFDDSIRISRMYGLQKVA